VAGLAPARKEIVKIPIPVDIVFDYVGIKQTSHPIDMSKLHKTGIAGISGCVPQPLLLPQAVR